MGLLIHAIYEGIKDKLQSFIDSELLTITIHASENTVSISVNNGKPTCISISIYCYCNDEHVFMTSEPWREKAKTKMVSIQPLRVPIIFDANNPQLLEKIIKHIEAKLTSE